MSARSCPSCGEPNPVGAAWCEACGSDLNVEPESVCVSCGAADGFDAGYCLRCGHKQPAEADHLEAVDVGDELPGSHIPGGVTAAVTDRGLRHRHNEDAFAIAGQSGGGGVLVVCDGVSSTPGSAEAATRAAAAASEVLVARSAAALVEVPPMDSVVAWLSESAGVAMEEASAAPRVAVSEPYELDSPPSSTFVAAVCLPGGTLTEGEMRTGGIVGVSWLGDSRAYWLPAGGREGAVLLTVDHQIAGSLSRWIGADAPNGPVDVVFHAVHEPGWLLLCSDGLWRYADAAEAMWDLVDEIRRNHDNGNAPATGSDAEIAVAITTRLIEFARSSGGHDNITAAVWASRPIERMDH